MFFGESVNWTISSILSRNAAVGEFWLDDLVLEPLRTPFLGYIETTAWKQEVFEDEIEIYVNMLINETAYDGGKHFKLTVEVVNEEGKVIDTLKKYEFEDREESRVATFKYDPSKLKEGYYKLRARSVDELFDNLEETIETNIHKLKEKRENSFYIDPKTRITYENGKPFFPLGVYAGYLNDSTIDALTDSPFNLAIFYRSLSKTELDHVYERSKGRVRALPSIGTFSSCTTNQTEIDGNYTRIVSRIKERKDSKGLFGYYISDEPSPCLAPLIRNITLTIRDLDPKHISYACYSRYNNVDLFKECSDVFGIDVYPLQFRGSIQEVYTRSIEARKRTCNARGMWHIPQMFDWERYAPSIDGKPPYDKINISLESAPSEQQYRQMVYQFISAGSMGFIFYYFDDLKAMDYKSPFDKEWAKVKRVVSELSEKYVPIITSPFPGNPRFSFPYLDAGHGKNWFGCRKFYYEGYSYLLIVNLLDSPQNFSFMKPDDVKESDFEMMMGSSKMKFKGNNVTLEMPNIEAVWLRVYDEKYMPDGVISSSQKLYPVMLSFISLLLLFVLL